MTGLDYKKDRLLEIAVLITNGNLDIVDPDGLNYIIKTDKDILDNMDPWCVKQHGEVRSQLPRGRTQCSHSYISLISSPA